MLLFKKTLQLIPKLTQIRHKPQRSMRSSELRESLRSIEFWIKSTKLRKLITKLRKRLSLTSNKLRWFSTGQTRVKRRKSRK